MYLLIENVGIAPIEGLTILGCTTTRYANNSDTIGEFGSGSKMGIALLLRHGIQPIIYCGTLRLEFFTEPVSVNDGLQSRIFNQVCIKATGKHDGKQLNRTEKLGWTLEYGEKDWSSVDMALREFVSNALDRSIRESGNIFNANVSEEDTPRAKSGYTRVYIPLTPEVKRYKDNIRDKFLHWSKKEKIFGTIDKKTPGPAKIYKKGVFVRTVNAEIPSLFDYNFDNSFKLDECRNVSDYAVAEYVSKYLALATEDEAVKVLQSITSPHWEHMCLSDWYFNYYLEQVKENNWEKAWDRVFGQNAVLASDSNTVNEFVSRKGYKPISLPSAMKSLKTKIKSYQDVLSEQETKGEVEVEVTPVVQEAFEKIWSLLEKHSLTINKSRPQVGCYKKLMNAGEVVQGYYKDGKVWINDILSESMNSTLLQVMLEECVHYITNATDGSRDLQEFLFRLIINMEFNNS